MRDFNQFLREELALEYHDVLNPKLWDDKKLKTDVRTALLRIADKWIDFTKIPSNAIKDILLTGGNANFNYTPYSDLDVHIWADFSKINKDKAFVTDYMTTKKQLWEDKYKLTVKGYPVEAYSQPLSEKPHQGQGVYSLKSDKWILEPVFLDLKFQSDPHIQRKVDYFKTRIDNIVNQKFDLAIASKLKEKIKNMRKSSIHKGGEFSFENLVFKDLRNEGYIKKLFDYISVESNKQLSVE